MKPIYSFETVSMLLDDIFTTCFSFKMNWYLRMVHEDTNDNFGNVGYLFFRIFSSEGIKAIWRERDGGGTEGLCFRPW